MSLNNGNSYRKYFMILGLFLGAFLILPSNAQAGDNTRNRMKLSKAIKSRDIKEVETLIDSSEVTIEEMSHEGETPLTESIYYGDEDAVFFLVKKGADVNREAGSGYTPLARLFKRDDWKSDDLAADIIEALVGAGVEVNEPVLEWRATPFMRACSQGLERCVEVLINAGTEIETKTSKGKRALMFAAESGNDDIVSILIKNDASLESRDIERKTALLHAITGGSYDVVKTLVDAGAKVDVRDTDKTTALMYAFATKKQPIMDLIFEYTIDFDGKNTNKQSLLHYVVRTNDVDKAQFLLDQGLKVNQTDIAGMTPFLKAVEANEEEMAMLLFQNGATVKAKNLDELSAVNYAAKNKNLTLLEFLVGKSVAVNQYNKHGLTPLMQAIIDHDIPVFSYLLEAGAKSNIKTQLALKIWSPSMRTSDVIVPAGVTPLEITRTLKRAEMEEMLLAKDTN